MFNKSTKPLIKRLYFHRDKKAFLDFDLEHYKTCNSILMELNKEIKEKIEKKYGKNVNLNNFAFIISDPKIYKQTNSTSLIEIKIDLNYDIYDFLAKQQYILYFAEKINNDRELKRKSRTNLIINNDRFLGVEKSNDKNIEKYFNNEKIYRYDNQKNIFNKEKCNIDEKKISFIIDRNNQKNVEINFIRKIFYHYDNNAKTNIPECLKDKKLKEIPDFLAEIHTPIEQYLFGQYRKGKINQPLENAINKAKIKSNFVTIDYDLSNELMNYSSLLFAKTHSIVSKCFSLKEIMQNLEKRKIFLHFFEDKKVSAIIENILSYKTNIKNKNYLLSLMNIKQILEYTENNYFDIFNEDLINKYKNISLNAEESISKLDNNSEKYEDEMKEILQNIFINDLFDEVYLKIFEKFIVPFHKEITNLLIKEYEFDKKPLIIQKFNKITANLFVDILEFRNIDNFNCLCSKTDKNDTQNTNESNS